MSCSRVAVLLSLSLVVVTDLGAQPLGTFRWQLQPFCNVVTVNVTQQGGIYTLDGTDDRCGGGNQPGSAAGLAFTTPSGLIGFGLTSVLPNGTPVHTEATISIASLNGTWRDSAGNSGTFVFTSGAGTGGSPRPVATGGLAAGSITNVLIAPNAVTGANVVNSSLTGEDIAPASIGNAQLAADAVTGDHIADGSVTIADLAHPPRIAFDSGEQDLALSATDAVVRSAAFIATTPGRAIVNATGFFRFNAAGAIDAGRCSITTGTALEASHQIIAAETVAASMDFVPFAGTRGYNVAAGTHTFNLVCDEFSGDVFVGDTSLTVLFVPTFTPPS